MVALKFLLTKSLLHPVISIILKILPENGRDFFIAIFVARHFLSITLYTWIATLLVVGMPVKARSPCVMREVSQPDQPPLFMTTIGKDGEMQEENWEDFSGILNKLKNYLFAYYEPVFNPTQAEMHFTTNELYLQLNEFLPCEGLTPDLVANWMDLGGFTFADYGSMRFEWMVKRKGQ